MNSSVADHEMMPPGCEIYVLLGGRLHQPSVVAQVVLIFIIIINILTFPFTAVLNALTMLAVKVKPRLRAQKSNILLALLASTDFIAGVIVQPFFIALIITLLLDEASSGVCAFQVFTKAATSCVFNASLIHIALISGERYLAIKHCFAYTTIVTDVRLLTASAFAWLLSVSLQIPRAIHITVFHTVNNVFIVLFIAFIVFCLVIVYFETRRHEQQIAAQQVTQEARKQFENNKKALKLTSTIVAVLILCYLPLVISRILFRYHSAVSVETTYMLTLTAVSMVLLNSLFNPNIYSVRMRQFRVAFIELTCTTVNIAEPEEIEMRVFGMPNAVARPEKGPEHEG